MSDDEVLPPLPPLDIRVRPAEYTHGPPDAYKNDTTPRGAVFIANYKNFQPFTLRAQDGSEQQVDLKTRNGSEQDVQHLHKLFRQMGYKIVEGLSDATKEETTEALTRFRDEKIHEEVDSMVAVFMSHGTEGDIFFTSDGEVMKCEGVIDFFSNSACPALHKKPKLFIFQMCRGGKEHIQVCDVHQDAAPIPASPQRKKMAARQISDVFVCFSSLTGFVSYRHANHGSIFVHHICRTFMEHAKDKALNVLMKRVNNDVPDAVACETREMATNLEFYFNPSAGEELPGVIKAYFQSMTITGERLRLPSLTEDIGIPQSSSEYLHLFPETEGDEESSRIRAAHRRLLGLVLIVNNLPGCERDVRTLNCVFSQLGYEVQGPFSNLTRDQLLKKVCEFKNVDDARSIFIIFYGDGFEDCLVSCDWRVTTYKELYEALNNNNCPNLAGKPKIFIFNTCFYDGEVVHEADTGRKETVESQPEIQLPEEWSVDSPGGKPKVVDLPAERDILVYRVEVDGHCEQGSRLTDAMCQVLHSSDGFREIMEVMRLVFRRLMELQDESEEQYYTEARSINFRQDFYVRLPPYTPSPTAPTTPPTPITSGMGFLQLPKKVRVKEVKNLIAGPRIYKNLSMPRGLAIIIPFSSYHTELLFDRVPHRLIDEANMLREIFTQCGYKVQMICNTSSQEIKRALREFKNNNQHRNVDSTVVIGLGLAENQNTFDLGGGEMLTVQDIYKYFTNTACPALMGKPKLFFFHMFLRDKPSRRFSVAEDLEDAFVLRLSSVRMRWREMSHPTTGIEVLCGKLENRAHDTHIESIANQMEVALENDPKNEGLLEAFTKQAMKFTREFYLNPEKIRESKFKPSTSGAEDVVVQKPRSMVE